MSRIGMHLVLAEDEVTQLQSLGDDRSRLELIYQFLDDTSDIEHRQLTVESGEAWDAMHRALTDGQLNCEVRWYPLSHVVLGGTSLASHADTVLSLKNPKQVKEIAAALANLNEDDFRRRFNAIDPQSYGAELTENDFAWTWECLQETEFLYTEAAAADLSVVFVLLNPQPMEQRSKHPSIFRDFGISPENLVAPQGPVRCFLTPRRIAFEYAMTAIMGVGGLALMLYFATLMAEPLNWLGCAATFLGFAAMIDLGTRSVNRWVEVDTTIITSKQLFTGHTRIRKIAEIASVETLILQIRQAETVVLDALFGRVLGVDIRFRDSRKPLRIRRVDPAMVNAEQFIEAVLYRMQQIGELETQMVNLDGVPLVGRVQWKGKEPGKLPASSLNVVTACVLICTGLFFGPILGCTGRQRLEKHAIASVPAQELTLAALIENGPGTNRHVTLTNYEGGMHIVQTNNDRWTNVWIPLFPAAEQAQEIKVVLSSESIHSDADVADLLQQGRITGICSETPRTSWGASLGPELIAANQNRPLVSAWTIEDWRDPPSANIMINFSTLFFLLTVLCSLWVLWFRD